MLEELFSRSLPRYTSSPYASDLDAFASMLRADGHCARGAAGHARRLLRVLDAAGLPPGASISTDALRVAFAAWPAKRYVGTRRFFQRFLSGRGQLLVSTQCQPRFALKQQYLQRLVDLRGIAPATVSYDDWALSDFLGRVLDPDEDVSSITPHDLEEFFRLRGPQLARRTFHHTVDVVRRFLHYAHDNGALPEPLHDFELPKAFRFEQPPRALAASHVQGLLASIDRSTPAGRRDHAILHLMAGYGLRPCEVATLKRSSIDWQGRTLRVEQSKTRSTLVMPLAPETIDVLHEHVRRCGVASGGAALFSRVQPPFGPVSACAISVRFKAHARRSGLPIADASAYALRHSFAMRLLGAGVDMKSIGDLLGHRSLASTSAYLRLQTDMLRDVALDVPAGVTP